MAQVSWPRADIWASVLCVRAYTLASHDQLRLVVHDFLLDRLCGREALLLLAHGGWGEGWVWAQIACRDRMRAEFAAIADRPP